MKKVTSKKSAIFIGLMFLTMIPPKAWGYAEKDFPPSFSDKPFSSDDNLSFSSVVLSGPDLSEANLTNETFAFSRAVLTNENGVAICQINLVENPEFLPVFAKPGSDTLEPLDLPECEQQNLVVVAQYTQQAWVKKDVAFAPLVGGALALAGGCVTGFVTWVYVTERRADIENRVLPTLTSGIYGAFLSLPALFRDSGWLKKLGTTTTLAGIGALSGLACYGMTDSIFYE